MGISTEPADLSYSVTPSDTVEQTVAGGTRYPRAFSANVAGDITYTTSGDTKAMLTVNAGTIYPISVKLIWSTGTDATGILIHG